MRLHPRYQVVARLRNDLERQLLEHLEAGDLTIVEALHTLAVLQKNLAVMLLRDERHPDDPTRKADEA
jgi:hypothetical protein